MSSLPIGLRHDSSTNIYWVQTRRSRSLECSSGVGRIGQSPKPLGQTRVGSCVCSHK